MGLLAHSPTLTPDHAPFESHGSQLRCLTWLNDTTKHHTRWHSDRRWAWITGRVSSTRPSISANPLTECDFRSHALHSSVPNWAVRCSLVNLHGQARKNFGPFTMSYKLETPPNSSFGAYFFQFLNSSTATTQSFPLAVSDPTTPSS